jgi:hypothetical protein
VALVPSELERECTDVDAAPPGVLTVVEEELLSSAKLADAEANKTRDNATASLFDLCNIANLL